MPSDRPFRAHAGLPSLLLIAAACAPSAPPPEVVTDTLGSAGRFQVVRLAEGVYAAVRREPVGFYAQPNTLLVEGEESALVVDAQFSAAATAEVMAALARFATKPVRHLVVTHPHDDHVTGIRVWRDAHPGLEVLAHAATVEALGTTAAANRRMFIQAIPPTVGYFRNLLETERGMAGGPITPEERAAYASDSTIASAYLREVPELDVVMPAAIDGDRREIDLGGRVVEVLHLGKAHSAGDLVVRVPDAGVVAAGDVVTVPIPLVGTTSFPRDFPGTLRALLDLGPRVLLPGHGPVLTDLARLDTVVAMLEDLNAQVDAAVAGGASSPEAVAARVDLSRWEAALAGESRLLRDIFSNYVAAPAVARSFEQARPTVPSGSAPGSS